MERLTMSVDDQLAKEFDELVQKSGASSRSEVMRDLLRRELETQRITHAANSWCVANLSYVYDHHVRNLAVRLNDAQHQHHDLVVSTMHVHLDHQNCLETVILKGLTQKVQQFAAAVKGERGVRHFSASIITVGRDDAHAGHGYHHHSGHTHLVPRS